MLGFESLFPCQRKTDHRPMVCFSFFWLWNSLPNNSAKGTGFAYPDRRSASSLVRRGEWVSSRSAWIPLLPDHRPMVCFSFFWLRNSLSKPSAEPLARHGYCRSPFLYRRRSAFNPLKFTSCQLDKIARIAVCVFLPQNASKKCHFYKPLLVTKFKIDYLQL